MALVTAIKNSMLDAMSSYFMEMYVGKVAATGEVTVDMTLSNPAVTPRLIGGSLSLFFDDATGSAIATKNAVGSVPYPPLNYSIPADSQLIQLYLTDDNATEGSRIVYGIIDIPAVAPNPYSTGDGAYYVRGLNITLTEV